MGQAEVEVVREMYLAFQRRDEAGLRKQLHPEVEWIQCPGFPGGDRRRGVDEVLSKVFGALRSQWEDFRVELDEYLDAGATVVVLGSYAGRHATSGEAMHALFAHVYDLAEGRITRYRQVADTWEMVRAMGG